MNMIKWLLGSPTWVGASGAVVTGWFIVTAAIGGFAGVRRVAGVGAAEELGAATDVGAKIAAGLGVGVGPETAVGTWLRIWEVEIWVGVWAAGNMKHFRSNIKSWSRFWNRNSIRTRSSIRSWKVVGKETIVGVKAGKVQEQQQK